MTRQPQSIIVNNLAHDKQVSITFIIFQKEQQQIFLKQLADSYEEQSNDPESQREIAVWNVAVGDGLTPNFYLDRQFLPQFQ